MSRRSEQGRPRRPPGVTLLALLQIWNGIVYFLIGLVVLEKSSSMSQSGESGSGIVLVIGLVYLVLALFAFLLARGYLRGREWARSRGIGVALFAILLVPIESIFFRGTSLDENSPLLTIIGNLVIIWYLSTSRTKKYFSGSA